jgi:hypothetical protein
MSAVEDHLVYCCENLLPPISGLYNFWATLTTLPMLLVPTAALRASLRQRAPWPVVAWLLSLTALFVGGTVQHALGPGRMVAHLLDPSVLGHVQNALLAGSLAGAPVALSAAVAAVPVVAARAASGAHQRLVHGAMEVIISPYVIGTMGWRSWADARSWRQFLGALASCACVHACTAAEPRLCGRPGAELFHAIANHLAISSLFGHVAVLALRLSRQKHGGSSLKPG